MTARGRFDADLARIRATYAGYDGDGRVQRRRDPANRGNQLVAGDRSAALVKALGPIKTSSKPRVLDVGCGAGHDLELLGEALPRIGRRLYGIDLLADRVARARSGVPRANVVIGDAAALPYDSNQFDLVLVSTVFSSVPSSAMAHQVASELERVVKSGSGRIVCFDVRYRNPANRNLRPISRRVLRALFPSADFVAQPVCLAAPLARHLGPRPDGIYRALNWCRPLRGHYLAVITPRRRS